jgi:ribosome-associated toxin RatA of RatAB toxin-antitoxin module
VTRRVATALVLLLLVGCGVAPAVRAGPLPLTDEHQRRVAAGEIVVIDTMPPGASPYAQGGTAVALVRAPVEKVWSILIDYPGHPRFYPRVVEVEVLKNNDGRALVRYVVAVGPMYFSFHMDKHQDAARRRIEWTLADGQPNSLFRENSGYWQVERRDGGSLVTYALAVRTVLPSFLTRAAERDSLVETINGIRRLAEPRDGVKP